MISPRGTWTTLYYGTLRSVGDEFHRVEIVSGWLGFQGETIQGFTSREIREVVEPRAEVHLHA
jgi:hypothetical protein